MAISSGFSYQSTRGIATGVIAASFLFGGVIPQKFTGDGSPSITKPTSAGTAEIIKTATGSPSITKPTSAGNAEIIKPSSGAPSITKPTAAGVAEIIKTSSGAPSITKPTSAGTAEIIKTASGSPSITKPTSAGTASLIGATPQGKQLVTQATRKAEPPASFLLGTNLAIEVVLERGGLHVGSARHSDGVQALQGVMRDIVPANVFTATGAPSITKPTSAGTAEIIKTSSGAPSITKPTAAGAAEIIKTATGAPSITKPTSAGTGSVTQIPRGKALIQQAAEHKAEPAASFTLNSLLSVALTASGSPSITKPTAAGTAEIIKPATGAPSITKPTAAGTAEVIKAGTGGPSITKPTAAGAAEIIKTGSGAPSITKPTSAGTGSVVGIPRGQSIIQPAVARRAEPPASFVHNFNTIQLLPGAGGPSITKPTSAGTAEIIKTASGAPSITKPTSAGSASLLGNFPISQGAMLIVQAAPIPRAHVWLRDTVPPAGLFTATGSPSITKPTAAGAAEIIKTASGSPSITKPTAAGAAEIVKTATGSPSITKPTAAGTAEVIKPSTGGPSITKPTAAGSAEIIKTASGSPSITKPTSAGTGSVSSALDLPQTIILIASAAQDRLQGSPPASLLRHLLPPPDVAPPLDNPTGGLTVGSAQHRAAFVLGQSLTQGSITRDAERSVRYISITTTEPVSRVPRSFLVGTVPPPDIRAELYRRIIVQAEPIALTPPVSVLVSIVTPPDIQAELYRNIIHTAAPLTLQTPQSWFVDTVPPDDVIFVPIADPFTGRHITPTVD